MGFESGLPSWQAARGWTFSVQHICIFFFFFDSGFVVHSVSLLKPERMKQVVKTRLALLAEFTEEAVSPQLPALWP